MDYELIAIRQLTHDRGTTAAGAKFAVGTISAADDLLDRGLARWPDPEDNRPAEPETELKTLALIALRAAVIAEQERLLEAHNSTTEDRLA